MKKLGLIAYGVLSHAVSLGSLVYFAGWLTNTVFAKTVDSGVPGPAVQSFVIDTVLLAIFCVSHSLLARTRVKEVMRRWVPRNLERATYCLLFGLLNAIAIRLQGVPLPGIGEVPVVFIQALPYVMTVVLLAGFIGRAVAPKAIGVPYTKES